MTWTWLDEVKNLRERRAFAVAWQKLVTGLQKRDAFGTDAWLEHIVGRFADSRTTSRSRRRVVQPGLLFWPAMRELLSQRGFNEIRSRRDEWREALYHSNVRLPVPSASIDAAFAVVAGATAIVQYEANALARSDLQDRLEKHFHESVCFFAASLGVEPPNPDENRFPQLNSDFATMCSVCCSHLVSRYTSFTGIEGQLPVSMAIRALEWVVGISSDHIIAADNPTIAAWALLITNTVDESFGTAAQLVITPDVLAKPSLLYPDPIHIGVITFDSAWTQGCVQAAKYVAEHSGISDRRSYRWRMQFLPSDTALQVAHAGQSRPQNYQRSHLVSGASATALVTAMLAVADSEGSWDPCVTSTGGMTDEGQIEAVDILPKLTPALWKHTAALAKMKYVAVHQENYQAATQALLAQDCLLPIRHVDELIKKGRLRTWSRRHAIMAGAGFTALGGGALLGLRYPRGQQLAPSQHGDLEIAKAIAMSIVAGPHNISEDQVFEEVVSRIRHGLPDRKLQDGELRAVVALAFRIRAESLRGLGVQRPSDSVTIRVAADKNPGSLELQVQAGEDVLQAFRKYPVREWQRRAEGYFKKALSLAEVGSLRWANLANVCSRILADNERYDEALPIAEKALKSYQNLGEGESAKAASAMNNIAQILELGRMPNREERVLKLTRSAIRVGEGCIPVDRDLSVYLNNLSRFLKDRRDFHAAELVIRRSILVTQADSSQTLSGIQLANLGLLLLDTGRAGLAGVFLRQAIAADERRYSPSHPIVATHFRGFGEWARRTDQRSLAVLLSLRALEIYEHCWGAISKESAAVINNIGITVSPTHFTRKLIRRALEMEVALSGNYTADVYRDLSYAFGRFTEEATSLRREALRIDASQESAAERMVPHLSGHIAFLANLVESKAPESAGQLRSLKAEIHREQTIVANDRHVAPADIVRRVEKILGPAMPVQTALATFDQQLEPWYLNLSKPIASKLRQTLHNSATWRNQLGTWYFGKSQWANAAIEFGEASRLLSTQTESFTDYDRKGLTQNNAVAINRALALHRLGHTELAQNYLLDLLDKMTAAQESIPIENVIVLHSLAGCSIRLGKLDQAKGYLNAASELITDAVPTGVKQDVSNLKIAIDSADSEAAIEELLGKPPADPVLAFTAAKDRRASLDKLIHTSITEPAAAITEKLTEEIATLDEALDELDQGYRKSNANIGWYGDVAHPISRHIDDLLENKPPNE